MFSFFTSEPASPEAKPNEQPAAQPQPEPRPLEDPVASAPVQVYPEQRISSQEMSNSAFMRRTIGSRAFDKDIQKISKAELAAMSQEPDSYGPSQEFDAQALAKVRTHNSRLRSHLASELLNERRLIEQLRLTRLRVSVAEGQIGSLKNREESLVREHREVEEEYHAMSRELARIVKATRSVSEELEKEKKEYVELWGQLDRTRRLHSKTAKAGAVVEGEINSMRSTAQTRLKNMHTRSSQTALDMSALDDLDNILHDCQLQRDTISRLKAAVVPMLT